MVEDLHYISVNKSALGPSEPYPGPKEVCGGTGLDVSMSREAEGIFGWGCSHTMKSWPQDMNGSRDDIFH